MQKARTEAVSTKSNKNHQLPRLAAQKEKSPMPKPAPKKKTPVPTPEPAVSPKSAELQAEPDSDGLVALPLPRVEQRKKAAVARAAEEAAAMAQELAELAQAGDDHQAAEEAATIATELTAIAQAKVAELALLPKVAEDPEAKAAVAKAAGEAAAMAEELVAMAKAGDDEEAAKEAAIMAKELAAIAQAAEVEAAAAKADELAAIAKAAEDQDELAAIAKAAEEEEEASATNTIEQAAADELAAIAKAAEAHEEDTAQHEDPSVTEDPLDKAFELQYKTDFCSAALPQRQRARRKSRGHQGAAAEASVETGVDGECAQRVSGAEDDVESCSGVGVEGTDVAGDRVSSMLQRDLNTSPGRRDSDDGACCIPAWCLLGLPLPTQAYSLNLLALTEHNASQHLYLNVSPLGVFLLI